MSWNSLKKFKIFGSAVSIGQPKRGVEKTPEFLKSIEIEKLIHPRNAFWVDILKQQSYKYEEHRTSPIRNSKDLGVYNKKLYKSIVENASKEDFWMTIGGDHSIASTTISALLNLYGKKLAVVWVDAHGDCNTPVTSPSGNYHGMPLSHVLDLFRNEDLDWGQPKLDLKSIAMLGNRDLDPEEKTLMDSIGLVYYPMEKIKKLGVKKSMDEIIEYLDPNKDKIIHLSMDVDGLDTSIMPGTGTLAPDGLTMEDYNVIVQKIRQAGDRFNSMDLVEINFDIEKEVTLKNVKELLRLTFS